MNLSLGGGLVATNLQDAVEELDSEAAKLASFAASDGSSLMGYLPVGTGATTTLTVQDKLREFVSIKDFGAALGSDCSAALIAASSATSGSVLVPAGTWTATATTSNSAQLLSTLNRIRCNGSLTINLATGTHNLTSQIVINSPDAHNIQILGASIVSTAATSQVSVTGSAKSYSVTIGVTSSTGIASGDYVSIRTDVAGTGDFYAHAGIWKVTAVDAGGSNRLTLLNTHHGSTFPTNTLTGGTVVAIKTVLKFTGCDGFRVEGGQPIGLLDRVAIVGDWSVATSTGTSGAHGLVGVSPVITGGASSNTVFNTESQVKLGASVGFSAWGEQGIAISGRGSLVGNFVAACSNRKRGFYSDGASFRTKYAVASGNGEDGFIADSTGYLQCAYAIASGNGLNGFWSTNNSLVAGAYAKASGNSTNGFESRGSSRLAADRGIAFGNKLHGFSASDGGMIDADTAESNANTLDGFYASLGAVIDANNATSKNNGRWGVNGDQADINFTGTGTFTGNTSGTFNPFMAGMRGYDNNDVLPTWCDGPIGSINGHPLRAGYDSTHYVDINSTSIGDLVIENNGTASFHAKAQGPFYPHVTGTQSLGRAGEAWSTVYASTGTIQPSDERLKQDIADLDEAELRVAQAIKSKIKKFRFKDAVVSKGDGARIHVGVIAQEVVAAFEAEGLDPMRYGVVCYDEWDAVLDAEGTAVKPAGNRYGVRYEELLVFIMAVS